VKQLFTVKRSARAGTVDLRIGHAVTAIVKPKATLRRTNNKPSMPAGQLIFRTTQIHVRIPRLRFRAAAPVRVLAGDKHRRRRRVDAVPAVLDDAGCWSYRFMPTARRSGNPPGSPCSALRRTA
jgi:hypothetical protein